MTPTERIQGVEGNSSLKLHPSLQGLIADIKNGIEQAKETAYKYDGEKIKRAFFSFMVQTALSLRRSSLITSETTPIVLPHVIEPNLVRVEDQKKNFSNTKLQEVFAKIIGILDPEESWTMFLTRQGFQRKNESEKANASQDTVTDEEAKTVFAIVPNLPTKYPDITAAVLFIGNENFEGYPLNMLLYSKRRASPVIELAIPNPYLKKGIKIQSQ